MNKNQNIAMGISLAVVAIMVGSAEIFGEKECGLSLRYLYFV